MKMFQKISLKLELDTDKVLILYYLTLLLCFLALLFETVTHAIGFKEFLIKVVSFAILYVLYLKIIKNLFYTFWSFSFFLGLYFLDGLTENCFGSGSSIIFYFYFVALFSLAIMCYILASPIYYPRVAWWEYDFRYRADFKVNVEFNSSTFEGRLADLRRNSGCVVLFKEQNVGDVISIKGIDAPFPFELKGEIMIKREYSLGRGYTYGVKFIFNNSQDRKTYKKIVKYWNHRKGQRRLLKFGAQKIE